MQNLFNFPDDLNVTVSKKDLVDLVNICLTKCSQQAKVFPEHLTIKQLSEYLNYSQPAVYKMVSEAGIPCYKISGKLLFKKSEIDCWLLEFKQPTLKSQIAKLDNKCK